MQLQRALVGAVIGGVIGVLILIGAYFLAGAEHTALAIVVAILVGLGVRTMVATKGHASYARGALAAVVALAAFVGGKMVVAGIAAGQTDTGIQRSNSPAPPPAAKEELGAGDESTAANLPAETAVHADQGHAPLSPPDANRPPMAPKIKLAYSPWDFLWLSVAALVAYELGRGSGTAPASPAIDPEST
jgi:hypothetical protein